MSPFLDVREHLVVAAEVDVAGGSFLFAASKAPLAPSAPSSVGGHQRPHDVGVPLQSACRCRSVRTGTVLDCSSDWTIFAPRGARGLSTPGPCRSSNSALPAWPALGLGLKSTSPLPPFLLRQALAELVAERLPGSGVVDVGERDARLRAVIAVCSSGLPLTRIGTPFFCAALIVSAHRLRGHRDHPDRAGLAGGEHLVDLLVLLGGIEVGLWTMAFQPFDFE